MGHAMQSQTRPPCALPTGRLLVGNRTVACPDHPRNIESDMNRVLSWIFVGVILASSLNRTAVAADAARPNIVFMLSDDQGWDGLSVAMHPDVPGSRGEFMHTPQLERLAAEGMRFSAGYAPAPVCSPTRISLQTGKSPAALHWTKAAPPEEGRRLTEPRNVKNLSDGEVTIAELLRAAGYATAHYGKWHIGGGGPGEHGYDEHDGDTGNENAARFTDPNPVDIFGMAERAERFMQRSSAAQKPFFIQLSWNALHAAENALQSTLAKYERLMPGANARTIARAAITEDLDAGVGRVLDSLDRLNLTGSTYVIYMGDNGSSGGGSRRALNSGKGGLWEGGIRVPFMVRGPGIAPDSWCHTRVVGYDLSPTFCEWAGIDPDLLPPGIEGGSLAAVLAQNGRGEVRRPREEFVFHFPHYQGDTPHSAIFLGDLKLIHFYEDGRDVLFDLSSDLGERRDIAVQRPDEARELRQRLEQYLTAIDAQLPTVNADYDPNRPVEPRKRGGRNKPGGKPKRN